MKKCAVPGPGTYMPKVGINKTGTYALSNIPNRKVTAWVPSNRFQKPKESREGSPGPGNYQFGDTNPQNKYVLSNYKSYGTPNLMGISGRNDL